MIEKSHEEFNQGQKEKRLQIHKGSVIKCLEWAANQRTVSTSMLTRQSNKASLRDSCTKAIDRAVSNKHNAYDKVTEHWSFNGKLMMFWVDGYTKYISTFILYLTLWL